MKTTLVRASRGRISRDGVRCAVDALTAGGVVVFPTDTVYGIAASVFRPHAVRRVYRLKGRSYKKPLPFLVADINQALALVEPPDAKLRRLLKTYWPGPLTVVFNTSALGRWTTGGKDTLALRVPAHPVTRAILKAMGQPLAVTSANRSSFPEAVTGREATRLFNGRVDVLVDGGQSPVGVASTVLNVSSLAWTLVREGAVAKKELLKFLSGTEATDEFS